MSAQLSYDIRQGKAYAGLIFAQAPHDIVSRAVETAGGIAFGVAVTRGTDADKQLFPLLPPTSWVLPFAHLKKKAELLVLSNGMPKKQPV